MLRIASTVTSHVRATVLSTRSLSECVCPKRLRNVLCTLIQSCSVHHGFYTDGTHTQWEMQACHPWLCFECIFLILAALQTQIKSPLIAHPKTVSIIGAPMTFGQPLQGAENAPNQIRKRGLHKVLFVSSFFLHLKALNQISCRFSRVWTGA